MNPLPDGELFQQLQERAARQHESINTLLERLLEQAQNYTLLADNITDLVSRHTLDGTYIYVTPSVVHILGYEPTAIIGTSAYNYIHPLDKGTVKQAQEMVLARNDVVTVTYRVLHAQGYHLWMESTSRVVLGADGSPQEIICVSRDITERKLTEIALRESQSRFKTMSDASPVMLWMADTDKACVFFNAAWLRFTGRSMAEEYGYGWVQGVHMDDRERCVRTYEHAFETRETFSMEYRLRRADGEYCWVQDHGIPYYDSNDEFVGYVGSCVDIHKRKLAEEALRQSEARYRSLFEEAPLPIWKQDFSGMKRYLDQLKAQGIGDLRAYLHANPQAVTECLSHVRVLAVNQVGMDVYGVQSIDELHANFSAIVHAEASQIESLMSIAEGKTSFMGEFLNNTISGEKVWILLKWVVVAGYEQDYREVLVSTFDITQRKTAEDALREQEKLNSGILRAVPSFLYVFDVVSLANVFANSGLTRILGYAPHELQILGNNLIPQIVHPDDQHIIYNGLQHVLTAPPSHEQPFEFNYRLRHKDGTYRWVQDQVIVFTRAEDGTVREILGAVIDISERKWAEEALLQNEARMRSVLETQSAYVVRTDLQGRYTYINRSFIKNYGWMYDNPDDFLGLPSMITVIEEDHSKTIAAAEQCIANPGEPVQVILRKLSPHSKFMWTLWEFVAVRDADNQVSEIQCIGFDITEQMHSREQLQLQESALLATADAIVITDPDANIQWVNPAFTQLTGYSYEEALGRNPSQLVLSGVQSQPFYQDMWDTILAGKVWKGRLVNRRKDGSLYTEEQTITPVYTADGALAHFVAIKRDVTDDEQAKSIRLEQERLKASLKKEQAFNALVQKAVSSLAHDVRTPLTIISNAKEMLDRYFDRLDEDKRREKLETIGKQLRYVLELLDDMTLTIKGSLSGDTFKPSAVNLAALCRVSINEIQETFGAKHPMRFVTDGKINAALLDETLMSRILLNLLSNAVKFSPDGGEITLDLALRDDLIVLKVCDEGIGIPPESQARIFEPFVRADNTRGIGGTGLGLNIVKDCVERHNGQIHVESQLGEGTRFIVEIPYIPVK